MGRPKRVSDEELLAAARGVFLAGGIGASTKTVARAVGLSEAAVYQRFKTKDELFFGAMIPAIGEGPDEVLFEQAEAEPDAALALEGMVLGLMDYYRDLMPLLVLLITHPSFDHDQFLDRHPHMPTETLQVRVVTFLTARQEAGELIAPHPEAFAETLIAALHSFALMEQLGAHGGRMGEEKIKNSVRALWAGLSIEKDVS
jgi:AcrR family transcriptional regulator